MHRRGHDGGGHIFKTQREHSRLQVNLADVADQRNIGVIDGYGELGLVLLSGGGVLRFRLAFAL